MKIFKKLQLPGIGMRIFKSAIAVALCVFVNQFRGGEGIAFYSQLAALWCIQMYRSNTIKNALQRVIGTLVGAVYGLIYLVLYPRITKLFGFTVMLDMIFAFVSIVLVIYTTVVIRKKEASYFSCVVFLSIAINHVFDTNPYMFVKNRILDTLIGIFIGVIINNIRICPKPDRNTLFVSGVDDMLINKKEQMSAFSKVELNRMIDDGMKFTISTKRTAASLAAPLLDIRLQYPVIVMDGAALYDFKTNEYLEVYIIPSEISKELTELFQTLGVHAYTNVIIDDTLLIYYDIPSDSANKTLIEKMKISPFRNYVQRSYPGDESVVYFMILDKTEKTEALYEKLNSLNYDKKLKILHYESDDYPGYSYLKIYNMNASKENMLSRLKSMYQIEHSITFGSIEGKYDVVVHENNFNETVKVLRRLYEPILIVNRLITAMHKSK